MISSMSTVFTTVCQSFPLSIDPYILIQSVPVFSAYPVPDALRDRLDLFSHLILTLLNSVFVHVKIEVHTGYLKRYARSHS